MGVANGIIPWKGSNHAASEVMQFLLFHKHPKAKQELARKATKTLD
jgi:hypothetical protein